MGWMGWDAVLPTAHESLALSFDSVGVTLVDECTT